MCRESLLNTRSKDIGRGIIMACSGGMEGNGRREDQAAGQVAGEIGEICWGSRVVWLKAYKL